MLRFSLGKFVILVGPDWGTTIVTLSGARRRIGEPDILRLNSSHFWSRPTGKSGPRPAAPRLPQTLALPDARSSRSTSLNRR
jgi:hypothetical protein